MFWIGTKVFRVVFSVLIQYVFIIIFQMVVKVLLCSCQDVLSVFRVPLQYVFVIIC